MSSADSKQREIDESVETKSEKSGLDQADQLEAIGESSVQRQEEDAVRKERGSRGESQQDGASIELNISSAIDEKTGEIRLFERDRSLEEAAREVSVSAEPERASRELLEGSQNAGTNPDTTERYIFPNGSEVQRGTDGDITVNGFVDEEGSLWRRLSTIDEKGSALWSAGEGNHKSATVSFDENGDINYTLESGEQGKDRTSQYLPGQPDSGVPEEDRARVAGKGDISLEEDGVESAERKQPKEFVDVQGNVWQREYEPESGQLISEQSTDGEGTLRTRQYKDGKLETEEWQWKDGMHFRKDYDPDTGKVLSTDLTGSDGGVTHTDYDPNSGNKTFERDTSPDGLSEKITLFDPKSGRPLVEDFTAEDGGTIHTEYHPVTGNKTIEQVKTKIGTTTSTEFDPESGNKIFEKRVAVDGSTHTIKYDAIADLLHAVFGIDIEDWFRPIDPSKLPFLHFHIAPYWMHIHIGYRS